MKSPALVRGSEGIQSTFRVCAPVVVGLLVVASVGACTDANQSLPAGDGGLDARPATRTDGSDAVAPLRPLWNGADLSEWDGDPKVWKALSGAIVGNAAVGSVPQTTYLILKGRNYADFVLTGDIRVGAGGNSGIVYRSTVTNATTCVVEGYQEDAADTYWGSLYIDGRGTVARPSTPCTRAVRPNDYNSFEIRATGRVFTHRLNGVDCLTYTDPAPGKSTGLIAIQYHMGGGYEVSVQNLRISEL